jgi:hypothetical protein
MGGAAFGVAAGDIEIRPRNLDALFLKACLVVYAKRHPQKGDVQNHEDHDRIGAAKGEAYRHSHVQKGEAAQ